jgi:hypothetical protein
MRAVPARAGEGTALIHSHADELPCRGERARGDYLEYYVILKYMRNELA